MSRAWPVALLAVAFGASGPAFADRPPVAPLACTCNARYMVPEHELPVPTNAKVWVFGGRATSARLAVDGATIDLTGRPDGNTMRFEPPLTANTRYAFTTDWTVNLVVGSGEDHTPPQQPEARGIFIAWHTVSSEVAYRTADLDIQATFSDDTALVRITFVDRGGRRTAIYTTPHRLHLCNAIPEIRDVAAVWLTALDVAGNESPAVAVTQTISNGAADIDMCADSYGANFNLPPVENYFLAIALMLGCGLAIGIVLMWLVRRTRYDGHAKPDPVSLLVAEQLVGGARRIHGLVCIGAFAGMITGITAGAQWLTVLIILIGWHVDGWLKARRAALLLANPAAGAELRGSRLTIVAHGSHASILVSRRAVRAAKQRAVPEASSL